jgi:hypothetical protein
MSTGYKFIYDREPTDEELQTITSAALVSSIEKAKLAKEEYAKNFNAYLAEAKIKYAELEKVYAATT